MASVFVRKDTVNTVVSCRPVQSRFITICLRATLIKACAPTSDYNDEVENSYVRLQEVLDQTPGKDILVAQDDFSAKIGCLQ